MNLPQGFSATGVAAGIKPSGRPDVALIASDRPAAAAGVFTTNRVVAAPIVVTKRNIRRGRARAIVTNAGVANVCTGARGLADAEEMATVTAQLLGVRPEDVLVASTGLIGAPMPMDKVRGGIEAAAKLLPDGTIHEAAKAIMTTDTTPKLAEATLASGARVTGIAKGAGMIAPEMATMLAYVLTDAPVSRRLLSKALAQATGRSFNAISVDGCMSTNDCVLVLANGAAGGETIDLDSPGAAELTEALEDVCRSLARQIVEDGEGATKIVTIRIIGAANEREARRAATALANSVLLRCALHGADPNWGRVMAALGASGILFDPDLVDVWMGGQKLCEHGSIGPGDLARAAVALKEREVEVAVDLRRGDAGFEFLCNDLSAEYVRINSEYTT